MNVAAHGDVGAYCEAHGMVIAERYTGNVEEYEGPNVVLVTDNCDSLNDYYYLKHKLRKRGVELVSTHWRNEDVASFVEHLEEREAKERKKVYLGRAPFGFRRVDGRLVEDPDGIAVARLIIKLRDEGWSHRKISDDARVHYPDGRRLSISTIQVILRNRGKYE